MADQYDAARQLPAEGIVNPNTRGKEDRSVFEALKGDRKGQCSIRINDPWRICFEWPDKSPGPMNVEIVDYH